jgi:hypothetical protein
MWFGAANESLTFRLSVGYRTGTGTVKVSGLTTRCRTVDPCGGAAGMLGFIRSFGDFLTYTWNIIVYLIWKEFEYCRGK